MILFARGGSIVCNPLSRQSDVRITSNMLLTILNLIQMRKNVYFIFNFFINLSRTTPVK